MVDSSAKNLDFDQDESGNNLGTTREVLEKEYNVDTADIKNPEGLIYVILDLTVNQHYDRAIRELKGYFKYKSSLPTYQRRTEKLFEHIENIIQAIKTKKSLMAVPNLSVSKKKELHNIVTAHFNDLKACLQKVTQTEYQIVITDSRSTLWVVNTLIVCAFIILAVALLQEAYYSVSAPLEVIERDLTKFFQKYIKI